MKSESRSVMHHYMIMTINEIHMSTWWRLCRHIYVHIVGTCHYVDGFLLVPVCLHPFPLFRFLPEASST